jgi:ubiquinone/menaquinone biosynthesis C-methylase UbiE
MSTAGEGFDSFAKEYDGWYDSPEGKVLFSMEVTAIRTLMKGVRKPFLEIGVGTGRFAGELGIDLGIDPSQEALAIAARRGISVKQAIGEDLPFSDESFGGIFILFTLCFVDEPCKVLAEARRVLKPDGGLIIGLINRESQWGKLYMKKKEEGHPIYKLARFYSVKEVVKMLGSAGMQVEAYSSALLQPPSESPYDEAACSSFKAGAGFVCILATKVQKMRRGSQRRAKNAA